MLLLLFTLVDLFRSPVSSLFRRYSCYNGRLRKTDASTVSIETHRWLITPMTRTSFFKTPLDDSSSLF
jgi:hypothetical protein